MAAGWYTDNAPCGVRFFNTQSTSCGFPHSIDGTTEAQTCTLHDSANAKQNVGPSLNVHGSAQDDVPESTYGSWIMVMRKKPGTKQQRGDGTTMNLHGQP